MIHRVKKDNDMHEGKWNGLGGKLSSGETPEECAVREIKEESGRDVTHMRLKGILTFPSVANNQDWYAFVFVVDAFEGDLIESVEGDLSWIPNDQLLNLNLWQGDRIFIPLLKEPGFFSGKFIYEGGELIDYDLVIYSEF